MVYWYSHESEKYGEITIFFDYQKVIQAVESANDCSMNNCTESALSRCGMSIEYFQRDDTEELEQEIKKYIGF
jgi:hypothetical protein